MDSIDIGGSLPITQFRFDMMVENPAIVMIAKRGSGKSWVCRAFIKHFEKIPVGIILSGTERVDPFFANFFPDTFIYYKYKSEIIEKFIRRQELIKKKCIDKQKEGKTIDTRAYIVMDDMFSQKGSWNKDELILDLLCNGRHSDITYVLTMQYPIGITPELRGNFDYIFLLADDTYTNIKKMHDHYAGIFATFESFRQVFLKLTENYGCMVVCKRGASANIFEKIFHYRAPKIENNDIKAGCYQFRKFHEENFNKNWYEDMREKEAFNFDEFAMKKKKDKSTIKVKLEGDSRNKYYR